MNLIFRCLIIRSLFTAMKSQTPEYSSSQYINTFLKYPKNTTQLREQFSSERQIKKIKQMPIKIIQMEYKLLSSAQIDKSVFSLDNLQTNRYSDIFAYEHSRVKIPQINKYYINANEVKSIVDNKIFAIFSQAPYKIYDSFWEAVYYKDIQCVIMLCKFYDPNRGYQSQQYWPDKNKSIKFSNGNLKDIDEEFTESTFQIEGPKGTKTVKHYHWTGWSDLKKPIQQTIHHFQFLIDLCMKQIEANKIPWIHCSAGIGRTGTLAGVVDALRYYKKHKKISIFKLVQNMRKYRYHAVQSIDQYRFLYSYLSKKL